MNPLWIGVDDTDSASDLCTTYLLTELIREFSELDIIGYPRLVRLNPMVPWKTRGNAALAVRLGKGAGKKTAVGQIGAKPIYSYSRKSRESPDIKDALARVRRIVLQNAALGKENTNPGFVVTAGGLPPILYRNAVSRIVQLKEVLPVLRKSGALYGGFGNRRGIIGASAAIAWQPGDRTYEVIAYRQKGKIGTQRRLDPQSVIRMDKKYPETFNNYDYENRHVCIAPSSSCPVFFGIRGDSPQRLAKAKDEIDAEEEPDRFIIYESNQGTDGHLRRRAVAEVEPYTCAILTGTVAAPPRAIAGGHWFFALRDKTGQIDCAAYEPSKQFRSVVRALAPGDRVQAFGGVREKPLTLNVEKLRVVSVARIMKKVANPLCKKCNKRMKSYGAGAGYRCKVCGARAGEGRAEYRIVKRLIKPGFYEPPPSARRHLAKPLKRMK